MPRTGTPPHLQGSVVPIPRINPPCRIVALTALVNTPPCHQGRKQRSSVSHELGYRTERSPGVGGEGRCRRGLPSTVGSRAVGGTTRRGTEARFHFTSRSWRACHLKQARGPPNTVQVQEQVPFTDWLGAHPLRLSQGCRSPGT